jgi:hypothetical protein
MFSVRVGYTIFIKAKSSTIVRRIVIRCRKVDNGFILSATGSNQKDKIMAVRQIEARVAVLEAQVAELRKKLENPDVGAKSSERLANPKKHWVDKVAGAFADDPEFLEAMKLGRKYRESLRPKTAKKSATRQPTKKKR